MLILYVSGKCKITAVMNTVVKECSSELTDFTRDTTSYGPQWKQITAINDTSPITELSKLESAFVHKSSAEINTVEFFGAMDRYVIVFLNFPFLSIFTDG